MSQLREQFAERIRLGINRKAITDASRWALKYRVMSHPYPGQWNFDHHPWLKDMHDTRYGSNVGQKAAQMGFTEVMLNVAFFFIDVRKMDVLYVLPNIRPDASDFSAGRFDKALELSPHLQELFSNVKNVNHKRAGYANLYLRGSNSRSQLKSIPVGLIILDELDEMNQANVPLALQRLAGQLERYDWKISTPTSPEFGINKAFLNSTQDHFFFPCPSCSRYIELRYRTH
jgi:phage terminase large subunit GpA-like protein